MSRILDRNYMKLLLPEIVRRLILFPGVRKLIIFGSVVQKVETKDSDLDILVVKEQVKNKYLEMIELKKSLKGMGIPIDVLIIDEIELAERSKSPSNAFYWALKTGKVVYDTI